LGKAGKRLSRFAQTPAGGRRPPAVARFAAENLSALLPIPAEGAGAIVREAVDWIGGDRAQIGDAVHHSPGRRRHRIIFVADVAARNIAARVAQIVTRIDMRGASDLGGLA
jgi:hypothetical protein